MGLPWKSSTYQVLGFAAFILLFNLVGEPLANRTILPVRVFLTLGWTMNDSWAPMAHAAEHLIEHSRDGQLYQEIFFSEKIKFQYPPTSLILPYFFSDTFASNAVILNYLSWIAVVLIVACSILIFTHLLRPGVREVRRDTFLRIGGLVLLGLMFYPIMHSHMIGQIQTFLTLQFALLFYFWLRKWEAPAGVMLGLMCLVKPQYGIMLIWGLLRRRWKFAFSATATGGTGLVASLVMFGIQNHISYLEVLSYLSRRGEAFYPNQSMNGLLNRLLQNGEAIVFQANEFPPYHPAVHYGLVLFAVVLIATAMVLPILWNRKGGALDLATIALAVTIASPIAWEHHYGILLPIFAYLFGYVMSRQVEIDHRGALLTVLLVSYLLSSTFLFGTTALVDVPIWNVLMSYLFFAALLALGSLLYLMSDSRALPKADRVDLSFSGLRGPK